MMGPDLVFNNAEAANRPIPQWI